MTAGINFLSWILQGTVIKIATNHPLSETLSKWLLHLYSAFICCYFLEKTLESPLDCKEIQPVHPKGDQSWVFTGSNDVEVETPVLWPPDAKS